MSETRSSDAHDLLRRFDDELSSLVAERVARLASPTFEYELVLLEDYEHLLAESFGQAVTPVEVMELARKRGRVIVHAPAGSGKTYLFVRLMETSLQAGIPVLVDLKLWTPGMLEGWAGLQGDPHLQIAFILEMLSSPRVDEAFLASLATSEPRYIFVDGLNEVPREVADSLLRALDGLASRRPNFAVLVADRLARRRLPSTDWQIATVAPMSATEVARVLSVREDEVDGYMRRPFFVNMAMGRPVASQAELIASFLEDQVNLEPAALDAYAHAAFQAYVRARSRMFPLSEFATAAGRDVGAELIEPGLVVEAPAGDAHFQHHLFHDYLASRYLVSHRGDWNHATLSAITFHAASFDVLSLVLEQLDAEVTDGFVRLIYDWNPYAPAYAIAHSSPTVKVSRDMCFALAAMLTERRWDPIEDTRIKSEDALLLLSARMDVEAFVSSSSLDDLLNTVRGYAPSSSLFKKWRRVFLGEFNDDPHHLIAYVADQDSLLGWTAANVLRRVTLDKDATSGLVDLVSETPEAVRWRAVHALGSQPSPEVVDRLLAVLRTDTDFFVQYGALRAVVELAARDETVRPTILQVVLDSLDEFGERRLLGELEASLVQEPAPEQWADFAEPIVEQLWSTATTPATQDRWRRLGYRVQSILEAAG